MALALALVIGGAATVKADSVTVYNSIPNQLPPNVASEGPEAYAYTQIGDGMNLAGPTGRTLDKIKVVLSSWGCQAGNWFTAGTCVTTPGATFTQLITVNVYSVAPGLPPAPGSLLGSVTQSYAIPYRPSSDSINCDGTAWYDSKTETCYHGLTTTIAFDLSSLNVPLPSQVIVGFEFNSTHYGPNPVGESAACFHTTAGCPYDSLNVSTDSDNGFFQSIGSVLDVDGIFFNYAIPGALSCTGAAPVGVFALDTAPGCWTGYHPEIQITAKTKKNEKCYTHGNKHNGKNVVSW
jgi:hypothetical protein